MRPADQPLTDSQIEAGIQRRIGGHVDPSLLRSIIAHAAVTRQERTRPAIGGGRTRLMAVLVAAVLGALGLGIVASGSRPSVPLPSQPPAPSVVALASPVPSGHEPSPVPSPAPSADDCATQTVDVATGDAMPPAESSPASIPAAMIAKGVYLTRVDGSAQTDVWAVSTGQVARIGAIVGPNLDITTLDDISADGRLALLAVGEFHMNIPRPECSDLYILQTDGSGATRLTRNGAGHQADNGAFSASGRYVAYHASAGIPATSALGVIDLAGVGAPEETACAPGYEIHPAWSPTGDQLAVRCNGATLLATVDGSGQTLIGDPGSVALPLDEFIGMVWPDASHVVDVSAISGTQYNGPVELRTIAVGSGSDASPAPSLSGAVGITPWLAQEPAQGVQLAPDGHAFVLLADPSDNDPNGDQMAYYVVDAATAHAKLFMDYRHNDIGWSTDSRSLVYVDWSSSTPILAVRDLAATKVRESAALPVTYVSGIWRAAPGDAP